MAPYQKHLLLAVALAGALAGAFFMASGIGSESAPPATSAVEKMDTPVEHADPSVTDIDQPFLLEPAGRAQPFADAGPEQAITHAGAPLPAKDVTLAEGLDVLLQAALSGDPHAGCRLATEISLCAALSHSRSFDEQLERSLASGTPRGSDNVMVEVLARSHDPREAANAKCTGVEVERLPRLDDFLQTAASRMSPLQKVVLAMMRQDGTLVRLPVRPGNQSLGSLHSAYVVPQYLADNTIRFLNEGYRAAEPLALEGLILLHAPGFLPGSTNGLRFAMPDPYRFAGYALLMEQLFGADALGPPTREMLEQALATLGAEQQARLAQQVQAEEDRWRRVGKLDRRSLMDVESRTADACAL